MKIESDVLIQYHNTSTFDVDHSVETFTIILASLKSERASLLSRQTGLITRKKGEKPSIVKHDIFTAQQVLNALAQAVPTLSFHFDGISGQQVEPRYPETIAYALDYLVPENSTHLNNESL